MSFINFINGFFAPGAHWFFWAGLACATIPTIIHLLNRRRYRVVQWAAMDFLREALQRNRRIMQLRDILLLILRTAVVLMLGMALAQARCTSSSENFDGSRPLHAVLLIDNSLSMGYQAEQSLGEDLLGRAKQKAKEYISHLPADSRVSLVALCGTRHALSPTPYTKEDAAEEVNKIEVVDGSATVQQALNEAKKACESGPDLDRRIVFFSDQQEGNWVGFKGSDDLKDLPPVQVIDVSPPDYDNTWISDLRLPDGLADVETPTNFVVELKHQGSAARANLQVTLTIDGVEAASKIVTLESGDGAREVSFEHVFSAYSPEPGKPVQVPVKATISPDRLPADDERYLIVNVVAALPVVFVDQFGSGEEDPVKFRLGETRHLRKLLAPVTSRGESPRQLVKIRHLKIDDLTRDNLADARLVVVGGIPDPGAAVILLREYVEQGGQLILAAGADFKTQNWNDSAWLDGAGILPAPLKVEPIGALPEESREKVKPFTLAYDSVSTDPYFRLADATDDELRDLYAEAFFFKAVVPDLSTATLDELKKHETKRLEEMLGFEREANTRREKLLSTTKGGDLTDLQREELRADDERLATLHPKWLLWSNRPVQPDDEGPTEDIAAHAARLADASLPKVRARFTDEQATPYLVERKLGEGQVLFVSSGLLSSWNTLPKTNTFLIYDRIMRQMIESTLPNRNYEPAGRILLAVPAHDQRAKVSLLRPGLEDSPEELDISAIGAESRGLDVANPLVRGLYRIIAVGTGETAGGASPAASSEEDEHQLWQLPLAVNGKSDESDLHALNREKFEKRVGDARLVWVGGNEEISLAGTQIKGQNAWWYFVVMLLVMLFVEMGIVAWPMLSARIAAQGAPA